MSQEVTRPCDLLVKQPLGLGKPKAFAGFSDDNIPAPIVRIIAMCQGTSFDLRILIVCYAKGDEFALSCLSILAHFLSHSLSQNR